MHTIDTANNCYLADISSSLCKEKGREMQVDLLYGAASDGDRAVRVRANAGDTIATVQQQREGGHLLKFLGGGGASTFLLELQFDDKLFNQLTKALTEYQNRDK